MRSSVLLVALAFAGTPCVAQTTDTPKVVQDSVHSRDGFNSNGSFSIPEWTYPVQLVPRLRDPTKVEYARFIEEAGECARQGPENSSLPGKGRSMAHCINIRMGLKEKDPNVPFLAEAIITAESR